jgi:hypothetical protein
LHKTLGIPYLNYERLYLNNERLIRLAFTIEQQERRGIRKKKKKEAMMTKTGPNALSPLTFTDETASEESTKGNSSHLIWDAKELFW